MTLLTATAVNSQASTGVVWPWCCSVWPHWAPWLPLALVYNNDLATRRDEAESRRNQAESDRNATQQAILRLMNEMGDLADGDLTVRATVTEDVTGAIADSVKLHD